MKALLVELNGKRVRLAGSESDDWGVLAIVAYGREDGQWVTRLDVSVSDKVRQEGYTWKMLPLTRGDIVTMQLIEAEVVDAWDVSIPLSQAGHVVPEGTPTTDWPPPSETIDAMLIEVNGQRIWLAGVDSGEWTTTACFDYIKVRGQWLMSVQVVVSDKSRGVDGGWPARLLRTNDIATFRLVEADAVDEFKVQFPAIGS